MKFFSRGMFNNKHTTYNVWNDMSICQKTGTEHVFRTCEFVTSQQISLKNPHAYQTRQPEYLKN